MSTQKLTEFGNAVSIKVGDIANHGLIGNVKVVDIRGAHAEVTDRNGKRYHLELTSLNPGEMTDEGLQENYGKHSAAAKAYDEDVENGAKDSATYKAAAKHHERAANTANTDSMIKYHKQKAEKYTTLAQTANESISILSEAVAELAEGMEWLEKTGQKDIAEAGKKGMSAHAKQVAAKRKQYEEEQLIKREKEQGETYNFGNAKVTKKGVTEGVGDYTVTASWTDRGQVHKRWDKDYPQGNAPDRHQSSIQMWKERGQEPKYHAHHRIEQGYWTNQSSRESPTKITHKSVHSTFDDAETALHSHTAELYRKQGVGESYQDFKTSLATGRANNKAETEKQYKELVAMRDKKEKQKADKKTNKQGVAEGSEDQGTKMNKICSRCGGSLFRFSNTIKCHKCNQTWKASPKNKEQGVAEGSENYSAYNHGQQDGWNGDSYKNPFNRQTQPEEWDDYKSGYQFGQTEAENEFGGQVDEGWKDKVATGVTAAAIAASAHGGGNFVAATQPTHNKPLPTITKRADHPWEGPVAAYKRVQRDKEVEKELNKNYHKHPTTKGKEGVAQEGWVRDTPDKFDLGISIPPRTHTKAGAEANYKRAIAARDYAIAGKQPKLAAKYQQDADRYKKIADNNGVE